MVKIEEPLDWIFLGFEKSTNPSKKYDGILLHKTRQTIKRVPFGDVRYQHFKDKTGLNLYSHLDHYDIQRRKAYRARHEKDMHDKYSSGWFASTFLWIAVFLSCL